MNTDTKENDNEILDVFEQECIGVRVVRHSKFCGDLDINTKKIKEIFNEPVKSNDKLNNSVISSFAEQFSRLPDPRIYNSHSVGLYYIILS
jgi:hypothetical protein